MGDTDSDASFKSADEEDSTLSENVSDGTSSADKKIDYLKECIAVQFDDEVPTKSEETLDVPEASKAGQTPTEIKHDNDDGSQAGKSQIPKEEVTESTVTHETLSSVIPKQVSSHSEIQTASVETMLECSLQSWARQIGMPSTGLEDLKASIANPEMQHVLEVKPREQQKVASKIERNDESDEGFSMGSDAEIDSEIDAPIPEMTCQPGTSVGNTGLKVYKPGYIDCYCEGDGKSPVSSLLDKMTDSSKDTAKTWGWSSWGSSILSTATTSMSSFRSQVEEGLSTVIQSVETTFGALPPEELAAQVREEEEQNPESTDPVIPEELQFIGQGLISTVSAVTTALETTSTKVIQGGLGTLEVIGKKTMDVIQEGDPGLKKKRAAFTGDKQTLSEVLREAKKKAETMQPQSSSPVKDTAKKINYSVVFDEFQGLIFLEALEMVSKNSEAKVASIVTRMPQSSVKELLETKMTEISDICVIEDCDDDSSDSSTELEATAIVIEELKTLGESLNFKKLDEIYQKGDDFISVWRESQQDIVLRKSTEHHNQAVRLLAEITAKSIELFHKMGELLLLPQNKSAVARARCLTDFSASVCLKVNFFAIKFSEHHHFNYTQGGGEFEETINDLITNVFLEATNSCTFIQDALRLLVPVLQLHLALESRKDI